MKFTLKAGFSSCISNVSLILQWLLYIHLTISFLTDIEKIYIVDDKDSPNTKRSTKVAKELFADYLKEKKLRKPEEKKELAQTLKTFYVEARKKEFVKCIIKQSLDSVFVISRIIKVSVRVIIYVSANNPYLDLDYSGYFKNLIQ